MRLLLHSQFAEAGTLFKDEATERSINDGYS